LHADEAKSWDALHERFAIKRISHQAPHCLDGACANMAEKHFPRLRRAKASFYRHIAPAYQLWYAPENTIDASPTEIR
jgi:hypothetical protein